MFYSESVFSVTTSLLKGFYQYGDMEFGDWISV